MKRFAIRVIIGIGLLAPALFGQLLNLAPDLLKVVSQTTGNVSVIVQFQSAPSPLQLLAIELLGGTVKSTYSLIPAVLVDLPVGQLLSLVNILGVVYISPDRPVGPLLDVTVPAVNA